jgi:hypothetical protein
MRQGVFWVVWCGCVMCGFRSWGDGSNCVCLFGYWWYHGCFGRE